MSKTLYYNLLSYHARKSLLFNGVGQSVVMASGEGSSFHVVPGSSAGAMKTDPLLSVLARLYFSP
jgi:hypothetical protein